MSSRKTNTSKRGGKSKKSKQGVSARFPQAQQFSAARSFPRTSPDQLDVPLMFRDTGSAVTTSGLIVRKYNPNAAYDVSPVLGSTETYGFDEYAHLYSYYRVISYSYEVTVVNTKTDDPSMPIMAYLTNTNTDPTIDGTSFYLYTTNPYCQSKLLSNFAGSHTQHVFRGTHQIAKIAGDPTVETADSYRSTTTDKPVDLVWLTLAFDSITTTIAMSIAFDVKILMNVRFYARENDLALSSVLIRIANYMEVKEKLRQQKLLEGKDHTNGIFVVKQQTPNFDAAVAALKQISELKKQAPNRETEISNPQEKTEVSPSAYNAGGQAPASGEHEAVRGLIVALQRLGQKME